MTATAGKGGGTLIWHPTINTGTTTSHPALVAAAARTIDRYQAWDVAWMVFGDES
jgi:hypothetical protein